MPLGKADLSLGNQFIQLILQPGQTQDPFTISNATGATLAKIDVNGNAFTKSLNATNITAKNIGGVIYADQYATLQDAINSADTNVDGYADLEIFLGNKTYFECVQVTASNTKLSGNGRTSKISCSTANTYAVSVLNATQTILSDFSISTGSPTTGGLYYFAQSQSILESSLRNIYINGVVKGGDGLSFRSGGGYEFTTINGENVYLNNYNNSLITRGNIKFTCTNCVFEYSTTGITSNAGILLLISPWFESVTTGLDLYGSVYVTMIEPKLSSVSTVANKTFQLGYTPRIYTVSSEIQSVGGLLGASGLAPFGWGNSASAPTAFGAGDTYFNTAKNLPCYYNGTNWNYYNNNSAGC